MTPLSEGRLLSISCLSHYLHFTQTLTTLNLEFNNIGAEGAQSLASALQWNTVRRDTSPSHISTTVFISHRQSQHWILKETRSALKEYSIWQVHWKWTESGSTSLQLIFQLLSSFHTDNHNTESWRKRDRCCRSTAFGKSIAREHSQTRLLFISHRNYYRRFKQTLTTLSLQYNKISAKGAQHLASALEVNTVRLDFSPSRISDLLFIPHRHLEHWVFNTTTSAMKERSI